jgi:outer membrane receptor for ferrienterochelin and colicins
MRRQVFLALVCGIFPVFIIAAQAAPSTPSPQFPSDYDTVFESEGVTVTGTRTQKRLKDSPVLTEVIDAEEIERSNADTVVDVLDDYGLMYTSNGMGDYVQMQGMGQNRVLYLVNGRRISGRVAQRLKGETLPLANVERIEIIRGPQSALYGSDAIGGVINIITRNPQDRINFSSSISNRFLLAYDDPATGFSSGPFDDFNLFREQNLSAVIGFPLGKSRNNVDVEAARGAFYYNEDASASILPRYYRGRVGLDSNLALTDSFELNFGGSAMLLRRDDQIDSWGGLNRRDYLRADAFVEGEWWVSRSAMLEFRLYDNYYQRDWDSYLALRDRWITGDRFENDNIAVLELLGTWQFSPRLLFMGGSEGAFSSTQKHNLTRSFAKIDREALFFQAEYFTDDSYSAIAGLRLERNSQFGFAASPKLSGMLHLGGGVRVFAGAGLGYRAPDFLDLYLDTDADGNAIIKGNPDLDPEYSLGFNLGLEWSKGAGFFQVNTYYQELFNEIATVYVAADDETVKMNIYRSLRAGMDAEGKLNLPFHTFFSSGYSYVFAWDRSAETELYVQPSHTVKLKAGIDLPAPNINAWFQARWLSKFKSAANPDSEQRFILDFYLSIRLNEHFRLNFGIDNITGEMDPIGPETAQTFSMGLKYTL